MSTWASTGLNGLDKILSGLKKGDNVVWQVDSIEDYSHFIAPYITKAKEDGRKIIYIRFARHKPLLEEEAGITIYQLQASYPLN